MLMRSTPVSARARHGAKIHAAGGLELDLRRGGITPADGLGDVLGPEVVDAG